MLRIVSSRVATAARRAAPKVKAFQQFQSPLDQPQLISDVPSFSRTASSWGWIASRPALKADHAKADSTESALIKEYEHATGIEREEIEAELQGKSRFNMTPPRGPFGTKEFPAIVESQFDERIVGCSGGVGEEEHDVLWFKLKTGQNHECPVCTQVFQLKCIGEGGIPGSHH